MRLITYLLWGRWQIINQAQGITHINDAKRFAENCMKLYPPKDWIGRDIMKITHRRVYEIYSGRA
jgi:hypothetical protein